MVCRRGGSSGRYHERRVAERERLPTPLLEAVSRYCAVSVLSIIGKRRKKEEACPLRGEKRRRRQRGRKRRRPRRCLQPTPSNSSLRRVSFTSLAAHRFPCPARPSFFLADSRCAVHPPFSATFGALPVFLSRRASFSAGLFHLSVLSSCPPDGDPRRSEVERKRNPVEVDGTSWR